MGLTTIFLVRHAFRSNWTTDPITGKTQSHIRTPTGIASDVALTAYGVLQAKEVAAQADVLSPKICRVYSSPFYRCLQTIEPLWARLKDVPLICNRGVGEWYGFAPFDHDTAADLETLQKYFPSLEEEISIVPPRSGETLEGLHDRCAYAMAKIIAAVDEVTNDEPVSIVICGHAAPLIAMSRALTGRMPEDPNEPDFNTYTCGISRFERVSFKSAEPKAWQEGQSTPDITWRGCGVGGGWTCKINGGVDHLQNGGERNWHFSGDESYVSMGDSTTTSTHARNTRAGKSQL